MLASLLILVLPHIGTPIIKAGQQHNTGDIDITVKTSSLSYKKSGVIVNPYSGATNATNSKIYIYPNTHSIINSVDPGDIILVGAHNPDLYIQGTGGFINWSSYTIMTVENIGTEPIYLYNREWKLNFQVNPGEKITYWS